MQETQEKHGFDPWEGQIPWRRKWHPIPAFLPGKCHGRGRLTGYSLWDCKEYDTTEATESTRTWELLNNNKKGSILYYTYDPVAYPPRDPASKANERMEVFFVLMCSCRQTHILTWKDQFQWQERQFWKDVELCKTPAKWHENILGNQPNLPNDLSSWASSLLVSMPFQLKIKQI